MHPEIIRDAPGYIEQVWNLKALSGIVIYGLPLEELLFGFAFGLVWTGIYEHLHRIAEEAQVIVDTALASTHI